jgi:hypothetical protein
VAYIVFLFHKFPAVLPLVNGVGLAVSCRKRVDSAVRCLSIIAAEKRCIPLDSCLPCSCVVFVYKIGKHCREYEDAFYLGKRKIEKSMEDRKGYEMQVELLYVI